jgi:hypothetical protein
VFPALAAPSSLSPMSHVVSFLQGSQIRVMLSDGLNSFICTFVYKGEFSTNSLGVI